MDTMLEEEIQLLNLDSDPTDREHHDLSCRCEDCGCIKSLALGTMKSLIGRTNSSSPGIYGPRGWSVLTGVSCLGMRYSDGDWLSLTESHIGGKIREVNEYIPYYGGDAWLAEQVLERLPAAAKAERQNDAPTVARILQYVQSNAGEIEFDGYLIGPQRLDERFSIDAIYVSPSALGYAGKDPEHAYQALQQQDLEQLGAPDEIILLYRDNKAYWRFWWD